MRRLIAWLILAGSFPVAGTLAQSVDYDRQLGARNALVVEQQMGLYNDDSLTAYITRVGNRLVAGLEDNPFTFTFHIANDEMPNAFALPGGYIYITRGLLSLLNNEDELATIMGHEIIHAYRRHSVKQMKKAILPAILELPGNLIGAVVGAPVGDLINTPIRAGNQLFLASYSRKYETEADKMGVALAAKAGYNPAEMNEILTRLAAYVEALSGQAEKRNYFNDHPFTPDRVKRINKHIDKLDWQPGTPLNNHLPALLNNLLYGADPAKGVFAKGNVFVHPTLELVVDFPDTWQTLNQWNMVGAAPEDQQAALFIMPDTSLAPRQAARLMADNLYARYQMRPDHEAEIRVAGQPAYRLDYSGNSNQGRVHLVLVWFRLNNHHYRLVATANDSLLEEANRVVAGIHRLTAAEKKLVRQYRLRVVAGSEHSDLRQLARQHQNRLKLNLLYLINDLDAGKPLPGGPVKLVVEEPYFK